MSNSAATHFNKVALRGGTAAVVTYLIIAALFELIWLLPMDTTERWLTAVHVSVITLLTAVFWTLAAHRLILVVGILLGIAAMAPALLIIMMTR